MNMSLFIGPIYLGKVLAPAGEFYMTIPPLEKLDVSYEKCTHTAYKFVNLTIVKVLYTV